MDTGTTHQVRQYSPSFCTYQNFIDLTGILEGDKAKPTASVCHLVTHDDHIRQLAVRLAEDEMAESVDSRRDRQRGGKIGMEVASRR